MTRPIPPRRVITGYLVLAFALFAGIVASGYAYLRHERTEARRRAIETISSVAELKTRHVAQWYRERRADAITILRSPIHGDLHQYISDPVNREHSERVRYWLETLQQEYDYSSVALLDGRGQVLLSAGSRIDTPPSVAEDCAKALRDHSVVIRNLHREGTDPGVRLSFLIPLSRDGPGTALLLEVDAQSFLFPSLLDWPTSSRTAEIVLVERRGDEVVFLNELRHHKDAPLNLRRPIREMSDTPSGRALIGQQGPYEGLDYRGVPVIAAMRPIPGTPWHLVAKIDVNEVYLGYRREAARTALFLSALLLAAIGGVSVLWYRRGLASAQREILLNERLRKVIDANVIGTVIVEPEGKIVEANDYYLRMVGLTREEVNAGRANWRDVTAPESMAADDHAIDELRETGVCQPFEKVYLRRDGTRVPALLAVASLPGPTAQIAAFALDLTDRKRDAAELERLAWQRQLALNAARMGWWTYDVVNDRVDMDDRAREMYRVAPGTLPIEDILARIHPDDIARVREVMGKAMVTTDPEPYTVEYRIVLPDGSHRWVQASGLTSFEEDAEGRHAVTFVGTLEDITDRRLADAALSERMDELRRWHEATLDRELRILELKQEVNALLARSGSGPRYRSVDGEFEPVPVDRDR